MSDFFRSLRFSVPAFTRFCLLLAAVSVATASLPAFAQTGDVIFSNGFTIEPDAFTAARVAKLISATGPVNTDVFIEVELEAQGNEAGVQYSIHFDPTVLSISSVNGVNANPDISLGSGAPAGTFLNVNAADAASGNVGVGQNFNGSNTNPPTTLAAGTRRIARLKFHILPTAAAGVSPVTFTNNPLNRGLFDENGFTISLPPFTDGNVTVGSVPNLVTISGKVSSPGGSGLRSSTVFLQDSTGARRTTTTSTFGLYQFDSVLTGQAYTIGVSSRSYRFSSRSVNLTGELTNFDFVGLE